MSPLYKDMPTLCKWDCDQLERTCLRTILAIQLFHADIQAYSCQVFLFFTKHAEFLKEVVL